MNASLKSVQDQVSPPFEDLFSGVEDLLKRIADIDSPELQKMRAKVRIALLAAQSAAKDGATHVSKRARFAAEKTDGYVRDYPWAALGVGALVGLGLGLMAIRASSQEGD
jgi:ElaB/YqjD/DUF883 family membrane-anchored ribosome-binding protein